MPPFQEEYLPLRQQEAADFSSFHETSGIPHDLIYPLGYYRAIKAGKMVGYINVELPQEMCFVKNLNIQSVVLDDAESPFVYPETTYMHEITEVDLHAFNTQLLGENKEPQHYLLANMTYSTDLSPEEFNPIMETFLEKIIAPSRTHLVAMSNHSLTAEAPDPKTFLALLLLRIMRLFEKLISRQE